MLFLLLVDDLKTVPIFVSKEMKFVNLLLERKKKNHFFFQDWNRLGPIKFHLNPIARLSGNFKTFEILVEEFLKKDVSALPKWYKKSFFCTPRINWDFNEFWSQKHSVCVVFSALFENRIYLGLTLLQMVQNQVWSFLSNLSLDTCK